MRWAMLGKKRVVPIVRRFRPRAIHIMDDRRAPRVCEHCGAVWDERHERGECGVVDATNRILGARRPLVCSYCGDPWDYNHELHGLPTRTPPGEEL